MTDDFYYLDLYRIPGTKIDEEVQDNSEEKQISNNKPAVLMMHCQDCDMNEWFWNTNANSAALTLIDSGYDVWLGNNRGSRFGQKHATLSADEIEFWEFYQEEMGVKDLPAIIDFVLEQTQ